MEQIFTRAGLIDPLVLRRLSRRSDARGWFQIGSHFGAIGLAGFALWAARGGWWAIPPFLLLGVLINYLYAGQHELSHSTVFKTRGLNEYWGRVIGFILITPRDADQLQHFAHHRHTQLWRQDGELYRQHFTFGSYVLRLLGIEYWYANGKTLLLYAIGRVDDPYIGAGRGKVIREARWHLAGYAAIAAGSLAAGSWAAMLYWLAPMLLTKPAHQLQNTIEHVGLPHSDNILENTRSTRTNAAMRWMAWQMQYHTAHHAFPAVPFHRLKELHHQLFTARGEAPATMTYLGFQRAVLMALWRQSEAHYPDDVTWIGPAYTPAR